MPVSNEPNKPQSVCGGEWQSVATPGFSKRVFAKRWRGRQVKVEMEKEQDVSQHPQDVSSF